MLFPVLYIVLQDLVSILLPTQTDYDAFVDHEEDLMGAGEEHKCLKGFVLDRQASVDCVLVFRLTSNLLVIYSWTL